MKKNSNSLVIVGINAYHADSSASIFIDGKLEAAIEEERLRRVKHWAGFPELSIKFCLQKTGMTFDDIDYFAIGRDPKAKLVNKLKYVLTHPFGNLSAIQDRLRNSHYVSSLEEELSKISSLDKGIFKNKIYNIEHHRSHLASSFFASPFEKAVCLSIDGSGDFSTTMAAIGNGNDLKVIHSIDFPHSIGLFYTAFTQLLGFNNYGDEYKVMGMAPYGNPIYLNKLKKVIQLTHDGFFKLNLKYFRSMTSGVISYGKEHKPIVASLFNKNLIKEFGLPRQKNEEITQYHKDLAASVQKIVENTIFHILNHLHQKTGIDNLCISGGVAQNSVANGKITSNTPFKNIYIPSAGHDAGISMGAALYVQHQIKNYKRQEAIISPYTGSHFSNKEIKAVLNEKGILFEEMEDEKIYDEVTDRIIGGGVIGWFTGNAEFGPRALGGRSILADPRRNDAKDLLNLKIKRRESFRPFAPSILMEYVQDYFECNETAPFMEKVFPIKKEKRHLIPAVTHVDGSGRVQTVNKLVSPRYYGLIEKFHQKTGVPILLNTSFNENEPIVNTPEEALNCFLRTDMDVLVMENIIVSKKK